MRKSDQAFSRRELKTFMWAMLISVIIGAIGLLLKEVVLSPSLGLYGAADYAASALPGVMDARPIEVGTSGF